MWIFLDLTAKHTFFCKHRNNKDIMAMSNSSNNLDWNSTEDKKGHF